MSKDPETAELKVEDRWIPVLLLSGRSTRCRTYLVIAFSLWNIYIYTLAILYSCYFRVSIHTLYSIDFKST